MERRGLLETLLRGAAPLTHATPKILVDSLHRLGTATGRDAYLNAAMAAADEVEANFFVNMAQILRGYHEKQSPITGIAMVGPLTLAQTKTGAAVIPFALDYGVWTAPAFFAATMASSMSVVAFAARCSSAW